MSAPPPAADISAPGRHFGFGPLADITPGTSISAAVQSPWSSHEFVLRLRFEVAGVVPLVELILGIAGQAINLAAPLHRRTLADHRGPTLHVLVVPYLQEFGTAVLVVLRQAAVPWPNRDVGDGVAIAGDVFVFSETPVEHVEQALRLHGKAVDGIFDLGRRIGVEMAEAATNVGRAAHLPEEPGQALGAGGALGR